MRNARGRGWNVPTVAGGWSAIVGCRLTPTFHQFGARRPVRLACHSVGMPRLTPQQLQEARRRSGKLGGRPANPTVAEARTAALERLVPKAIRVLEEHLDSGRPDAWRSACKILEHSWGPPPEPL